MFSLGNGEWRLYWFFSQIARSHETVTRILHIWQGITLILKYCHIGIWEQNNSYLTFKNVFGHCYRYSVPWFQKMFMNLFVLIFFFFLVSTLKTSGWWHLMLLQLLIENQSIIKEFVFSLSSKYELSANLNIQMFMFLIISARRGRPRW